MLNDLLSIERALVARGIPFDPIHPDIQDVGKSDLIVVRLDSRGCIDEIELRDKSSDREFWTMRDGKHNSFPNMKYQRGLLTCDEQVVRDVEIEWNTAGKNGDSGKKREILFEMLNTCPQSENAAHWPPQGYRQRLRERLSILSVLSNDLDSASVPAAFERFLAAAEASRGLLPALLDHLRGQISNASEEWLDVFFKALVEKCNLLIDVATADFQRDAGDVRQKPPISTALGAEIGIDGTCPLTGIAGPMLSGNFPQTTLPTLGLTFLFSRNKDIPAFHRYGRYHSSAFPLGQDIAARLSGALSWITHKSRKGKTWRSIPGDKPNSPDLLISFVAADTNLSMADELAHEDDDDIADQSSVFQELSRRVLAESKGEYVQRFAQESAKLLVLRKVDEGNRKAIFTRDTTVEHIHFAAENWREACNNAPPWFRLPVPSMKGTGSAKMLFAHPPPVRPLSLLKFSKTAFIRNATEKTELTGIGAAEAFGFFLDETDRERRARHFLRLLFERRIQLLTRIASLNRRGKDDLFKADRNASLRRETLRTVTWIGILLHALGHKKDVYMNDPGFRLGQLLAVADVVHLGYCEDQRDGSVPTTLIGNAVLTMAGKTPRRALSLLLDRWKPYDAWVKRSGSMIAKAQSLKTSSSPSDKSRGWTLSAALFQSREIKPTALALSGTLPERGDDTFRAELLLGYLAGLPPPKKSTGGAGDQLSTSPQSGNEGDDA